MDAGDPAGTASGVADRRVTAAKTCSATEIRINRREKWCRDGGSSRRKAVDGRDGVGSADEELGVVLSLSVCVGVTEEAGSRQAGGVGVEGKFLPQPPKAWKRSELDAEP